MDTQTPTADIENPPHAGWWWLKRIVATVLILLLMLLGAMVLRQRRAADRLQQAVEELDRTDPGWRLADVEAARAPVPDAENGALLARQVGLALPKPWPPEKFDDVLRAAPNERLSPEAFTLLKSELEPLGVYLEMARGLAHLPGGRFPITYARNPLMTLLPDQQNLRVVGQLLVYDARHLAEKGRRKEALHSCRAALNAARALGDEPFLVSQLIRIALDILACNAVERTLALGEADPKDLEEVQRLLAQEDAFDGLRSALRGERGMMHEVYSLIETGELSSEELSKLYSHQRSLRDRYLPWAAANDARAEHPLALSLMTRRVEMAGLALHEQVAAERAFDRDFPDRTADAWLTRLLLPAVTKVSDANRRRHAHLRCLIAALAAERYRLAHGRWPESLNQLSPKFLNTVPLDPFDGAPLRYLRVADGVVIYSVSSDGADDGGNLDRDHPTAKGADLGYRLWDVRHRGQPAKPAPPAVLPGVPPR